MSKLDQKVAVITGAAQGIGRQIALTLAAEGADIVVADIREMEAVAREVKNLGRKVLTVRTDVSKREDVKNLVDTAIDSFKKVDILINNAGTTRRKSLVETTEEDWDAVLDVNLKGVFLCTQAVAPYMIERKYGKIVNIASIAAFLYFPMSVDYSTSKAGVVQLTRACSRELGCYGINVNAVAPGVILTDIISVGKTEAQLNQYLEERKRLTVLGRVGTPQDIANLVLFLVSDESSFITGQVICADGGYPAPDYGVV